MNALRSIGPAVVLLLLVASCSSSNAATDEVATLQVGGSELEDAADAATVDDALATSDLPPDEAALEFSQCMRDQGLDFPDLSVDAEGNIELRAAFQSIDRGAEGFDEAMQACGEVLQQTGFGGGAGRRAALDSPEVQDALLEFSECVRSDGYDVGDLTLGPPGQGPAAGAGQGAGDNGGEAGQGQQGQRQQGFGNRAARFAQNLGLDYDDPEVQVTVDECMTVVDEAFAAAGIGQPQG